jgi:hypothetical protein
MKLLADRVLHRYTPPTCTLELWAKQSLFGWHSPHLPQDFRFELRFDDPRLSEDRQVTVKGDRVQLDRLCDVVSGYIQNFLEQTCSHHLGTNTPSSACVATVEPLLYAPSDSLSFTPQGLLSHQFCFGLLESPSHVNPLVFLTTSQLLDLTNALEEYSRDLTPKLEERSPTEGKSFWVWTGAALLGLIAVGLAGAGLKVFSPRSAEVGNITPMLPVHTQFTFTEILPPIPPAPSKNPPSNPSLPTSLALRDPLPPPTTIAAASPPPRNPTVNLVVPPARVLLPPPAVPPAPPSQTIMIVPATGNPNLPPPPPGSAMANPFIPPVNSQANLPILPPQGAPIPNFQGQVIPSAPQLPPLAMNSQTPSQSALPPGVKPLVAPTNNNTNLLDTIPQVAEIRNYFQEKWQPPDNLSQTLEYRLRIKSDGSLDQSIPLGKAASLYLSQVPMPNQGQKFVSPLPMPEEQTVRLVLSPNGTVKTFLE